jgi:two-component system response regulator DctR
MLDQATIYLCDDEEDVLEAVSFLLRQAGFQVRTYLGGKELLSAIEAEPNPLRAIFVLDLYMPPMDGDLVHDQLIALGYTRRSPVIFLSGHGVISRAVNAVSKGALSYVEKPHTAESLLPLLNRAVELERQWNTEARRHDFLQFMWDSLTDRQRQVALLVASGMPNRNSADELHIVERTVEVTRARVFEKLGVDSAAALATTVAEMQRCGIIPVKPSPRN